MFEFFKVHCGYVWETEEDAGDNVFTFGSLEGAREWVERQDDLRWYSIEGLKVLPCNGLDYGGQLYYGMTHHEFHEVFREEVG